MRGGGAPAVLLPGVVLPAELAYPALVEALGDRARALAKELEVYSAGQPAAGYTLDLEVEGILRTADQAGFERFHLVGYSGGGAASLVFAAEHPQRLLSLALMEPAWAGNSGLSAPEVAVWAEFDRIMGLPPEERMADFVRAQLRPGVAPPPPPDGPPPPWMATRPAGVAAMIGAFKSYDLDQGRLRAFTGPVYYAVGGLSNPDYYARQADRLGDLFPDFALEVYEDRHHFDPPHRAEPERVAAALERLWARAAPS
jgi:pimeloyl-ACP methyl ester carboxylesterase